MDYRWIDGLLKDGQLMGDEWLIGGWVANWGMGGTYGDG